MVCVFSTSGQNYNFALLCYLVTNLCGNAVYFVQKMLKLSRRLVSSRLEYSRKRNYDIFPSSSIFGDPGADSGKV